MKRTLALLHALALGAFLAGCSSGDKTPPANPGVEAAASRDADIRAILNMSRRGEISDTQAVRLIAALRGISMDDAAGASSAQSVAATAPSTAIVEAPASVPAITPATTTTVVPAATVANNPVLTHATRPAEPHGVKRGYKPGARIAGRLRSTGSDSMDRMMEEWAKGFAAYQPKLRVSHEGKGSSTAVPALLEGRADVGPMSRPLKKEEIAQFVAKFGYAPTQIRTAVDALAIYVHPDNPILATGLTTKQLDAIFSSTRKRGGAAVTTWGDLGLTGEWKGAPVRLVSRNSASGTYGFFRDEVLAKGEFREDTKFLVGSAEVVEAVAHDRFAIGYSGIGYKTSSVSVVKIAATETSGYKEPTEANALTGDYPVSRSLFVTLNRKPGEPVSDLHREFIAYILSTEGQDAVRREGYFALPAKEVPAELVKLL